MSASYHRKWKVQIGQLATDALRVQFKVTKTLGKEPNTLDLYVWNLAEASRKKLTAPRLPVTLEAGYLGQTAGSAIIFSGDARTIDDVRDHADWKTHVQCGDGEKAYQFSHINKAFASTFSFTSVCQEVAKSLGVNLGNLTQALQSAPKLISNFTKGFVANGRASDVLSTLLKSAGLEYSIHQGSLLVVAPGKPASNTVFTLTPATGLIGSPDHTPPDQKNKPATLKCKCLLNPQLTLASIVHIESARVKGDFVIQKLDHIGDSHGADWITVIEAWAKV